eukprot:6751354-Prymnesium_polylepis.3
MQAVSDGQSTREASSAVDDGDAREDRLTWMLQEGGRQHASAILIREVGLSLDQTALQQLAVFVRVEDCHVVR